MLISLAILEATWTGEVQPRLALFLNKTEQNYFYEFLPQTRSITFVIEAYLTMSVVKCRQAMKTYVLFKPSRVKHGFGSVTALHGATSSVNSLRHVVFVIHQGLLLHYALLQIRKYVLWLEYSLFMSSERAVKQEVWL